MSSATYYYKSYKTGLIIFNCEADDLLEADKMYSAAGHGDPEKQSYVGCFKVCHHCDHSTCVHQRTLGFGKKL